MKTLTRKDVANLIGFSVWYIKRREAALGLDKCRLKLGGRSVRYDCEKVRLALLSIGLTLH